MAQLNFDSTGIEPTQPFTPLPPGRYDVEIEDSEIKTTKRGDGEYLQLTFTVLAGDYVGRKVWGRMNIKNPSKAAEDIARRELAAVCQAVGLVRVRDSSELHNRPLQIDVGIEKNKETGDETNRIKGYVAAEGAARPSSPPSGGSPAAPAKAPPPWAAKKQAA